MKSSAPLVASCLCLFGMAATAQPLPLSDPSAGPESPPAYWRLMFSPATYHYRYDSSHRHVYMLGAERQHDGGFVAGGTWFRNSFGQPSTYLYAGRRFGAVGGHDALFVQLTAGVLYGYKPPYEDKVPLNRHGFSPGAVASFGWQFTHRYSAQVNLLGNSALMLQFSADLH